MSRAQAGRAPGIGLAVIFDVDGVLVDSYHAHHRSWRVLAQRAGIDMTADLFARSFGQTSREIIHALWPDPKPDDDTVRAIDDEKEALYREIVAERFPAMDGAAELIDALDAAGFALGVGSSGPPENVGLALERLGRRDRFRAVVTGRDIARGKPDPEVFLKGAAMLGVESSRCVVIEDAVPGVIAAVRAGMSAIGLASTGRVPGDLLNAGARSVHRSLREITPEVIARRIAEAQPHRAGGL